MIKTKMFLASGERETMELVNKFLIENNISKGEFIGIERATNNILQGFRIYWWE